MRKKKREKVGTWKNFRWAGHLTDATLIVTGSMPLHRREKRKVEKDLNQWDLNITTRKRIFSLCFYFLFVSCLKISSFEPYPCQKRHLRLIILQQRKQRTSLLSIFFQTLPAFNWAYQLRRSSSSSWDSFGTSRQSYHVVSLPFTAAIFT